MGFQYNINLDKDADVRQEMTGCLDTWKIQDANKKKKKPQKTNVEEKSEVSVKSLGKATAELLPKEGTVDVWTISSDDESEPEEVTAVYDSPEKRGV